MTPKDTLFSSTTILVTANSKMCEVVYKKAVHRHPLQTARTEDPEEREMNGGAAFSIGDSRFSSAGDISYGKLPQPVSMKHTHLHDPLLELTESSNLLRLGMPPADWKWTGSLVDHSCIPGTHHDKSNSEASRKDVA